VLVALLSLLLGCTQAASRSPDGSVTVFAASSLTEAFEDLAEQFERREPDIDIRLAFAGSQTLRLQIAQGASADVFASADRTHLDALVGSGMLSEPVPFAHNSLALIVPTSNPAGIERFADLPRAARIVVGAPSVPIGAYTASLLERASHTFGSSFVQTVRAHVVSEEANVRLVRARVELEEADAAVVYHTDAMNSDRVHSVPIPEHLNVRAEYAMGLVRGSGSAAFARRWLDFVRSTEGRRILERHGFGVP